MHKVNSVKQNVIPPSLVLKFKVTKKLVAVVKNKEGGFSSELRQTIENRERTSQIIPLKGASNVVITRKIWCPKKRVDKLAGIIKDKTNNMPNIKTTIYINKLF